MKKFIIFIVVTLCLSFKIGYSNETPDLPDRIKVAVYENPPLVNLNSVITSKTIYPNLLKYIAERENWQLEFVSGTWEECLERLQNNQVDIMTAIAYSQERASKYIFSEENVLINWGQIFIHKDLDLESIPDFKNKIIGVLPKDIYYIGEKGIKALFTEFAINCQFNEYESYDMIFQAISEGQIHGGVTNRLRGTILESQYPVKATSIIFMPNELRFAFPANSNFAKQLSSTIDRYLVDLKNDRDSFYYNTLIGLLHSVKPTEKKFIRNFIIVIVIAIFISLILFLWNWTLKKTIRLKTSELRNSEHNYRNLYTMFHLMADNMPDMIWAKDLDMNYLFVNKAITKDLLIAKDTQEPLGKNDLYFAQRQREKHPENPHWHTFGEICVNSDEIVIKNKKPQRFEEFGNVKGKFLFLDVHKAPFWDENGKMIGTVGSARDMTKEKNLEKEREETIEQLKEREEFNFTLFNNNPVETIVVDKNAKILKTNLAARTNQTSIPELGNIMYKDYNMNSDRDMYKELIDSMKTGKVKKFSEIHYDNKFFSVTIAPMPNGAIITSVDITERKYAQDQIEKLTRVFEELGSEPENNIDFIVQQTNRLLNGACSLYNRLDDESKSLCIWAISNKPEDIQMVDNPDGHICYEATIKNKNKPVIIPDLDKTEYAKTDHNVRKYNLKSYLGYPVIVKSEPIGSLCIVDNKIRDFNNIEVKIISTLAKALSIEEERIIAKKRLRKSLYEKEILLKEIHHRVKNNMQIISSLLKLQTRKIPDKKTKELFKTSHQRVKTMALIHEKLYASSDLINIDFKNYVQKLTDQIFRHFMDTARNLSFNLDIDDIFLDINKAIPCGLIINELVTNSLKYAFPNSANGKIDISLKKKSTQGIELRIKDNGIGLPEKIDMENPDSLGLQIVQALVNQLHGKIDFSSKNGTEFFIRFSLIQQKRKKKDKSQNLNNF